MEHKEFSHYEIKYLTPEAIHQLSIKFPEKRKRIHDYYGYLWGDQGNQKLDEAIGKFFTKLHNNRDNLAKEYRPENEKYFKKEQHDLFGKTFTNQFQAAPAQVFEDLLGIMPTIGHLRKQQLKAKGDTKKDIVDTFILSEKEKDFFMIAASSPSLENRYLLNTLINRMGVEKTFLTLKTLFLKFKQITTIKDPHKDKYYKYEAEKVLPVRVDKPHVKFLKKFFKLYTENEKQHPDAQMELF